MLSCNNEFQFVESLWKTYNKTQVVGFTTLPLDEIWRVLKTLISEIRELSLSLPMPKQWASPEGNQILDTVSI